MSISVVTADRHVLLRFKQLLQELPDKLKFDFIEDASINAWRFISDEMPVKTGKLRSSMRMWYRPEQGQFTISITAPYARMIELGTGGGDIIKPRKARFLRYPNGKYGAKGYWKFSRQVIRGRVKSNPFMMRSSQRLSRWVAQWIHNYIGRLS